MSRFAFAIVRYVPDSLRGEFTNVGAVVGGEEGSEWRVAQRAGLGTDRLPLPEGAEDAVRAFLAELGQRTRAEVGDPEAVLDTLRGRHVRTLQLSRPSAVVAPSIDAALTLVMEKLVERPAGRVLVLAEARSVERRTRVPPWAVAVAASLLLAFGIWMLGSREREPERSWEAAGVDRLIAAAAETLRQREPALYAGFEPVSAADRAHQPGGGAVRGALLAVLSPQGKVVADRPVIRFERGPRQDLLTLRLDAGGPNGPLESTVLLEPTRDLEIVEREWPSGWPSLEAGQRVQGEMSGRGILGEARGRFVVERASAEEAQRFRAQVEGVDRADFGPLGDLVKAQIAFRAGLLGEAERYARRYAYVHPLDQVGRDTLGFIRAYIAAKAGL